MTRASTAAPLRIAVLVTCFNRAETTLASLALLRDALDDAKGVTWQVHLVDDGSPDKTGERVKRAFPAINVIEGTGDLFYVRGMQLAYREALDHGPYDAYLLFCDDVAVDAKAAQDFIALYRSLNAERSTALVAAMTAIASDRVTHSAYRLKSRHRPLSGQSLMPAREPIECDTFCSNFVLVPAVAFEALGGFDTNLWHSFGDIDLGLSLRKIGTRLVLAPIPIGRCDDHGTAKRSRHGLLKRLKMGLTGVNDPRLRIHVVRKHSPTRLGAAVAIVGTVVKRVWVLALNRPHLAEASPHAKN